MKTEHFRAKDIVFYPSHVSPFLGTWTFHEQVGFMEFGGNRPETMPDQVMWDRSNLSMGKIHPDPEERGLLCPLTRESKCECTYDEIHIIFLIF